MNLYPGLFAELEHFFPGTSGIVVAMAARAVHATRLLGGGGGGGGGGGVSGPDGLLQCQEQPLAREHQGRQA